VDDLENPNTGPAREEALRAVRERNQLEESEQKMWRWPSAGEWIIQIILCFVVAVIAGVLGRM
jgi:hypothetical protein